MRLRIANGVGLTPGSGHEYRFVLVACLLLLVIWTLASFDHLKLIPTVTVNFGSRSRYNESKVALLIENRPMPNLVPLILHMISVVPSDWRFRFMGSNESLHLVNQSQAIRHHVGAGKLDLTDIPSNMSVTGQQAISQFLTTLWLYETVLQPAEWLLVYQTDSLLCANSERSLNDYLEYDWVGAPWGADYFGGNGGLSLRRVSAITEILQHQVRIPGKDRAEDVWLSEHLARRPGARMANSTVELTFSFETTRDDSIKPMGYHIGGSGKWPMGAILGTPERRKEVWDYCPELKLVLEEMQPEEFITDNCNENWKRNTASRDTWQDHEFSTDLIAW